MGKLATLYQYASTGCSLGADWRSRWILATLLPRSKVTTALGIRNDEVWQVSLQVANLRVPFWVRTDDVFILNEMLGSSPYCPEWLRTDPPKLIVDLGAHIGLATIQFKAHFSDAVVHCYEPDPENFRLLAANTSTLGGVAIHHEAVGAVSGEGVFHARPLRRSASSLVPPRDAEGVQRIRVGVRSLDDILTDVGGPDLVKFDIEGMEYEVFSVSRLIHEIRFIVGELKGSEAEVKRSLELFPRHDALLTGITPRMHYVYLRRR